MFAALALALLVALAAWAQIEGDRGIAPVAASRDIRVSGIAVDAKGDTPQEARENGWREAARLAWAGIGGPRLSDGQLGSMVSSIVIESEQLGPRRYIARLGVIFDRARASGYLGGEGEVARSAPLLLIPVTVTAGTETVFERRNPWQRAWAEYQTGASRIEYVRPSGAGGDSLLITYGQAGRRSRLWWRNVLDQFGASDVLIAIARLDYDYPGGPVTGRFTARYGPDNSWLGEFTLRATSPAHLPAMLAQAAQRFDAIYTHALDAGRLRPDPTLDLETPVLPAEVQALIEQGRAIAAREEAARAGELGVETPLPGETGTPAPAATPAAITIVTVQFATPDPASVDAAVGAVRATPGVRGAATTSLALGGTSLMRVTFAGGAAELAEALRARGFTVREAGGGLSISR
ncbi:MAG: heavy-metal-associated domain-containing protein [Qipengyuania sp.]|nr:heavy-metal-associated domain-containing protein [Qipengyuania sp.]